MIGSCRDIGVIGCTAVAHFVPVGVEPFQFIGVLVFTVEDIVQGTIFNGYIGLIMIEYNLLLSGNVFLQYILLVIGTYQVVINV